MCIRDRAYTNTYAPAEYLERIFTEAVYHKEIVALSVATRPDCLQEDVQMCIRDRAGPMGHVKHGA